MSDPQALIDEIVGVSQILATVLGDLAMAVFAMKAKQPVNMDKILSDLKSAFTTFEQIHANHQAAQQASH